jgi:hypothetical protein
MTTSNKQLASPERGQSALPYAFVMEREVKCGFHKIDRIYGMLDISDKSKVVIQFALHNPSRSMFGRESHTMMNLQLDMKTAKKLVEELQKAVELLPEQPKERSDSV